MSQSRPIWPPHRVALPLAAALFGISGVGWAAGESKPEPEASWFEELTWQRSSTVGLAITEGIGAPSGSFKPTRELKLTDKSKVVLGRSSLVWNLRLQVNRDALPGRNKPDDTYVERPVTLPNGSIMEAGRQLVVQEAYAQHVQDAWLIQAGSQAYSWGSADSINTINVMNPGDLRAGFIGDKETKVSPVPTVRLALLGEGQTLNLIYAPWRRAPLLPGPTQNWYVNPDNLSFGIDLASEEHVQSQGSVAIKYDQSIAEGEFSLLYYAGADYDFSAVPTSLLVRNNQPLAVRATQTIPDKTLVGATYSQTFGKWVLKGEGAYSPNKKAMPEVDRTKIASQKFPLPLASTPSFETTVGVNYFASIKKIFGLPVGETILTAEYHRAQYLKAGIAAPMFGDVGVLNVRTTTMEDRLEVMLTGVADIAKIGRAANIKLTYSGEDLRHSLAFSGFTGDTPPDGSIGSLFYYWREKSFAAYELTYPF